MKSVLYIIAIFFSATLFAQKKYSRAQFRKDSLAIVEVKTVRLQLRIYNKVTFYKGDSYNIRGFDVGVLLKERIRLALGYFSLNDKLSGYAKTTDGQYFDRRLQLRYGSIDIEYIYHNSRFFTLGLPVEFGFGQNQLKYKSSPNNESFNTARGFISLIDFGASGMFRPIRWVGLRTVVGYRKIIINQVPGPKFDGVFLSVGVAVNFREITKDLKMFKLKRKYKRLGDPLDTAVDLITD